MSNSNDFQHLATIVRELRRFGPDMGSAGHQLNEYVTLARSIIRLLDQAPHNQRPLIQRAAGLDVQVFIVSKLQDLAYYEPDMGAIGDIADWCVRQWLRLLQDYPEDVGVLQGLGHAWLLRSQTSLARIQQEEGSSSSGMCGGDCRSDFTDDLDESTDAAYANEANNRRHTADYVEARATLQPATEYLARAVHIAERQGVLHGRLLSLAAEAYMSRGNVAYTNNNEQFYRQALLYLRRASQIPGYRLSPYLQRYLDDYGRLMD